MKTKIEDGIEYELIDSSIWYPKLKSKTGDIKLGEYGLMRLKYLEQNKSGLYEQLFLGGELFSHCKGLEIQAKQMKVTIVKQCLAKDMDIIQASEIAEETVKHDLIFS